MRALDIDLDFFLEGTCELAPVGERPDASEASVWSEARVRAFLQTQCGLSAARPIPGRVFETHDQMLFYWRERVREPLSVTHVDAHSDLGIGAPGPAFVLENVITRPPQSRASIEAYYRANELDEANFLLFALAFRWIGALENVRNPYSRPDMPAAFCHPGYIQLCSSVGRLIPSLDHREPRVPFRVYSDHQAFRADAPYDFATLAISPRYAPREADVLVPIFRSYIRED